MLYLFGLQKNNELTVDAWVSMSWTDPRLRWTPSDFEGVKSVTLTNDKIWKPDVILWNGYADMSIS